MPASFGYSEFGYAIFGGSWAVGGGGGAGGGGGTTGATSAARDKHVIEAMAAALDATGQFAATLPHQAAGRARLTADENPVATVRYLGHGEDDLSSGATIIRTSRFEVVIAYRAEESDDRIPELDRLANVAANAIVGKAHAGITFPYHTVASGGAADVPAGQPTGTIRITGTYAYLIDGFASRLTT